MKNKEKQSLNLKKVQGIMKLSLKLGYSHPIYLDIPSSVIKFDLYAKGTVLYIQGIDKQYYQVLLNQFKVLDLRAL